MSKTVNAAPPTTRKNPPAAVMKIANRVMKTLLRTPLHPVVSKKVALLTFTGRKSGKTFTTPVAYIRDGDTVWFGTERPWKRNLDGAEVTLTLAGKPVRARTELITDEIGMAAGYKTILRHDPKYGRFIGVTLGPDGEPDPAQVAAAKAQGLAVIQATPI